MCVEAGALKCLCEGGEAGRGLAREAAALRASLGLLSLHERLQDQLRLLRRQVLLWVGVCVCIEVLLAHGVYQRVGACAELTLVRG